jgi:NAD-dependent dihydropyrimidine dehydrogenase PreA subunit
MKKKIIITFPPSKVEKPLVHTLIKEYGLWVNIHRAIIEPQKHGKIVVELRGNEDKIDRGIRFIVGEGMNVNELERDVVIDKDKCVDCGICTSICPTNALKLDKETYRLTIDYDECIVCGFCQDTCPVNAILINF